MQQFLMKHCSYPGMKLFRYYQSSKYLKVQVFDGTVNNKHLCAENENYDHGLGITQTCLFGHCSSEISLRRLIFCFKIIIVDERLSYSNDLFEHFRSVSNYLQITVLTSNRQLYFFIE